MVEAGHPFFGPPPPERSHFVEYDDEVSAQLLSSVANTKATGDSGGGGSSSVSGPPRVTDRSNDNEYEYGDSARITFNMT